MCFSRQNIVRVKDKVKTKSADISEKQSEDETNTHGTKGEDDRKGSGRLGKGKRQEEMLRNRRYELIEKGRQQGSYFFRLKMKYRRINDKYVQTLLYINGQYKGGDEGLHVK